MDIFIEQKEVEQAIMEYVAGKFGGTVDTSNWTLKLATTRSPLGVTGTVTIAELASVNTNGISPIAKPTLAPVGNSSKTADIAMGNQKGSVEKTPAAVGDESDQEFKGTSGVTHDPLETDPDAKEESSEVTSTAPVKKATRKKVFS